MVDISRKTYEGNDKETIADNERIFAVKLKLVEERLNH